VQYGYRVGGEGMIARFDSYGHDAYMEPVEDGQYVLYEDYLNEMKIMRIGIDFWKNAATSWRVEDE